MMNALPSAPHGPSPYGAPAPQAQLPQPQPLLPLDVRGTSMTVPAALLTGLPRGNRLADALVGASGLRTPSGVPYLARNPHTFHLLLDYYANDHRLPRGLDRRRLGQLELEARHFALEDLYAECKTLYPLRCAVREAKAAGNAAGRVAGLEALSAALRQEGLFAEAARCGLKAVRLSGAQHAAQPALAGASAAQCRPGALPPGAMPWSSPVQLASTGLTPTWPNLSFSPVLSPLPSYVLAPQAPLMPDVRALAALPSLSSQQASPVALGQVASPGSPFVFGPPSLGHDPEVPADVPVGGHDLAFGSPNEPTYEEYAAWADEDPTWLPRESVSRPTSYRPTTTTQSSDDQLRSSSLAAFAGHPLPPASPQRFTSARGATAESTSPQPYVLAQAQVQRRVSAPATAPAATVGALPAQPAHQRNESIRSWQSQVVQDPAEAFGAPSPPASVDRDAGSRYSGHGGNIFGL